MYINEYGSGKDPTVILLAPMMITGSELYEVMSPCFRGVYHIIAPDQGGHGKAGGYISADEEYRTLKEFLLSSDLRTIELVYGASLGAAVAYRLFLDPDFTVRRAWFDGAALCREAVLAETVMKSTFRSRKRKLAKTGSEASPTLVEMYGWDFARRMTKNFERITPEDIDAICHACCHYDLRPLTDEEQSKLHLDFGEKDFDWKYARKTVPVYMPKAELSIRPGCPHCGYMAAHTKEYVEEIEAFMAGKGQEVR